MAQMKIRGNTQILAGTITNTEISGSAAIASSKLADGANFIKKDGSVAMTGALTLSANPTNALHAATKQYVDNLSTGVMWKASVRAASTANVALTGTQTIDGIALAAGNRVLLKNQTAAAENGIWVVAAGAWSRAADADVSSEVMSGMSVWVNEGTVNADSQWLLVTDGVITLGTTGLTFTQVSGLGQIAAGNGLTKSGNTMNVAAADASIQVNADSIQVKRDTSGIGAGNLTVTAAGIRVSDISVFENVGITDGGATRFLSLGTGGEIVSDGSFMAPSVLIKNAANATALLSQATASRTIFFKDRGGNVSLIEDFICEEVPSGLINGSNTAYTLANTPVAGTVAVYLNGVRLRSGAGNDYTIAGNAITMLYAPTTGDVLIAEYIK